MNQLTVSKSMRNFECGGKPFFYLADTIWMAFTHITFEEWEEYLEYRRMQGFNALQISVLPVLHDMTESKLDIHPFELNANGKYVFSKINHEYFQRAEKMLEAAIKFDMIPVLAPLWTNYIPGTWAADLTQGNQMPLFELEPYIKHIITTFSRFNPIYMVSADTKFETEEVNDYYMKMLDTIKAESPEALTTMHSAPYAEIPERFVKSDKLDFYMYQSGHALEHQHLPYIVAESLYENQPPKPIINGEPCYEGCGYGFKYGRFNEFDVRKAMWRSLLSGAKAGFTYGAHGVWGWHVKGRSFKGEHFSSMPFEWKTALRFKGAWDVSFGKTLFEKYNLYDIEPVHKILNKTDEIRMSADKDLNKVVIYAPFNIDIQVDLDLYGFEFILVNLTERYFAKPDIRVENGHSVIKMHEFNSDVLLIGIK
jgi:hypothetical protein